MWQVLSNTQSTFFFVWEVAFIFIHSPPPPVFLARAQKNLLCIASRKNPKFIKISRFLGAPLTLWIFWDLSTIYNISQSLDCAACVLKPFNVGESMEIPQLTWQCLFLNQPFANKTPLRAASFACWLSCLLSQGKPSLADWAVLWHWQLFAAGNLHIFSPGKETAIWCHCSSFGEQTL